MPILPPGFAANVLNSHPQQTCCRFWGDVHSAAPVRAHLCCRRASSLTSTWPSRPTSWAGTPSSPLPRPRCHPRLWAQMRTSFRKWQWTPSWCVDACVGVRVGGRSRARGPGRAQGGGRECLQACKCSLQALFLLCGRVWKVRGNCGSCMLGPASSQPA